MTKSKKYLIYLLSVAIRDINPTPPEEIIDWQELFLIAESQKVHTLIYPVIEKLPSQFKPPSDMLESWRKITMVSVFDFAKQAQQLEPISKAFEHEKVPVIFLKGAVLRDLYPVPELRTMSDFDILVHEDDRERAKSIFNKLEYTTKLDYPTTMEFKKEGLIKFEVFFKVFGNMKIDASDFTLHLWENAISWENNSAYVLRLNNEDFLLHIISHLAKHLKGCGAGVRNLCDIVLYIEKNCESINWNYITRNLDLIGLGRFFGILLIVLKRNFNIRDINGVSIPSTEEDIRSADILLEYMLAHGLYGTPFEENLYLTKIKRVGGSDVKWYIEYLQQVFPPITKLSSRYNYAKKFPVTLPLAWIHRLFFLRFVRRITLTDAVSQIKSSRPGIEAKDLLLKDLDLR